MVFLNYDQAALDRQYDQRAWAPNAAEIIRGYSVQSDAVRARLGEPRVFSYGASAAETLDVYPAAQPNAPLHVFIHGGAWRLLGKRDSAFAAEMFVHAGAHFVAVDFALLPVVTLTEMVSQVRHAVAWLYRHAGQFGGNPDRIYLSGHSSGGHLAASVVVTDWQAQFGLPRDIVKGAICASGIYDLLPVRLSGRNDYVRIDTRTEADLSPLRHLDKLACLVAVAYGEFESDEFRRQSQTFAAALAKTPFGSIIVEDKGHNHFEVANTLADRDGTLGRLALNQMKL